MSQATHTSTHWCIAGKSDIGIERLTNEDAFFCDGESGGFFAVADGVGGLEFGERASRTAVEGVCRFFEKETFPLPECPDFIELYRKIDAEIDALGEALSGGFGIATTLDIIADGGNGKLYCAHVGDGGIFLFRENTIVKLTEEHTLAAEELARGNRDFPEVYTNTLTRALGVSVNWKPQIFSLETRPGDRILAATDGITRILTEETLEKFLGGEDVSPQSIAAALISAANAAGGYDNSTAVVAFIS